MISNTSSHEETAKGEDAPHESITHLLHRACQVADVIFAEEARDKGLTTRQYAVLIAVDGNKDVSQTGLVRLTGIDRSTLAEIVKRLIGKKLLKRRRTRLDARTYAVRLTEEGETLLKSAAPAAARADDRIMAVLMPERREIFANSLNSLVNAFPAER